MWVLFVSALIFIVYAIASLVLPLRLKLRTTIIWSLVAVAFGLKYFIYSQTGGVLEPQLSPLSIVVMEATFSALMLAVFLAILKDLLLLGRTIYRVVRKVPKFERRPWPLERISLVIAIVACSSGVLGTIYQFKTPDVYTYELEVEDLAPELEGYKIVQLTDLHLGPILKRDFLQGVVERVNAEEPDLVVITGDFVDGSVAKLKDEFLPLRELKAKDGVLAVTGNHEYYSGANSWVSTLEKLGVQFLKNESVLLSQAPAGDAAQSAHAGERSSNPERAAVLVSGVPDHHGSAFGEEEPDFELSLRQLKPSIGQSNTPAVSAAANASFRLLLAHEPAIVTQRPEVDLILTGHTHGGTMFFLKPLIAHFNEGYVSGLYELNPRTKLYVSNGTGIWSGFSCRVLVPSEITSFVLHGK